MDTDESVLPFSDLDKIGWKWGLFYIILFVILTFIIPSLLLLKDIKSKGISAKEITFNNIRESLQATLIRGNIIEQIKHFTDQGAGAGAAAGAAGAAGAAADPVIVNPDEIPPKTCSDIHGNPDNPIPYTCVSEGEELISSPENKTCLPNSGCTELDCCVNSGSSSCKLGLFSPWYRMPDFTGNRLREVLTPPIRGTYDNEISNNIMDYLDLSEISPDISRPQYNWPDQDRYTVYDTRWTQHTVDMETPFILNCNAGYVNPDEYTTELRDLYSVTNIITDYERQAVITCGEEGYLKYGQNNDFFPCSVNTNPCELSIITKPVNGQWGSICSSNSGEISNGTSCDFTCDTGYTLTDQPSCNNGDLTSTTATCTLIPRTCADINAEGVDNPFPCSSGKVLNSDPTGVTCSGDTCTETECCVNSSYHLGETGQSCTEVCTRINLNCVENPPEFSQASIFDADGPFGDLNCDQSGRTWGSHTISIAERRGGRLPAAPFVDYLVNTTPAEGSNSNSPPACYYAGSVSNCDEIPRLSWMGQNRPRQQGSKRLCKCREP